MGNRNYDTTSNRAYPRVTEINIKYSTVGVPRITYVEQMAVVDANGDVYHVSDTAKEYQLDITRIQEPVACVRSDTGQLIPGMWVTRQQLMLGLLAFLRADQNRRDEEQDASRSA